VRDGFGRLPAGCFFHFDERAREEVLNQLRRSIPSTWTELVALLREPAFHALTLDAFLDATDVELGDIYAPKRSWTLLRQAAHLARYELDEAEPLLHQELEAMRAVAGPRHPDTLVSMNNMALLLQDMDKVDEALPLFEEALEVKRSVLGPRDPGTLTSMNNLAMLLQDMGKLQEAEPLFREAYKTRREVLGQTHPRTLTSLNNLAGLLYVKGKLNEAEAYYRQCLDARRMTLGDGHSSTLDSMNNLALVLKDQGKELEAEDAAIEFLRSSGRISEVYEAGEWSEKLDEGV